MKLKEKLKDYNIIPTRQKIVNDLENISDLIKDNAEPTDALFDTVGKLDDLMSNIYELTFTNPDWIVEANENRKDFIESVDKALEIEKL